MDTSGVVGGRRMRGKRDLVFNSYFYYLTSSPTEGYFNMGYFNNKNIKKSFHFQYLLFQVLYSNFEHCFYQVIIPLKYYAFRWEKKSIRNAQALIKHKYDLYPFNRNIISNSQRPVPSTEEISGEEWGEVAVMSCYWVCVLLSPKQTQMLRNLKAEWQILSLSLQFHFLRPELTLSL